MLRNLKISTKIISTVLLVSLIGLLLSAYAAMQMQRIDDDYTYLVAQRDPGIMKVLRASRFVNQAGYAAYRTIVYDGQSTEAQNSMKQVDTSLDNVAKLLAAGEDNLPDAKTDIEALETVFAQIAEKAKQGASLGMRNQNDAARDVLIAMDPLVDAYMKQSVALGDRLIADSAARSEGLDRNTDATTMLTLAGTLFGMVIGIGGAMIVSRKGITGPLNLLGQRMEELASGRLDVPVEGTERGDEIGSMAQAVQVFKDAANQNKVLERQAAEAQAAQAASRDRQAAIDGAKAEDLKVFVHAVEAGFDRLSDGDLTVRMDQAVASEFEPIRVKFNTSLETLESTIGSVVGAVGSMRVGLNEITIAATDLSQRTEQQAASLEETVAALSEVTRGVNETAGTAMQAQSTAQSVQQTAEKGGAIVTQAVNAMGEIERSSAEIGKIIGVIDEIAFQTNLLALNAGVEAARAGEAGRGFAVVAQEVRGLAQRSAEAAKEIKDLISTSSNQVEQGVELVTASGRSLDEIVAGVGTLAGVVATIARSAKEQSVSLKEVSTAADQMDKVTQQNAAMVEETTAAAQSLTSETEDLAKLTERFQARASGGHAHGAAPARRPAATRPAQAPVAAYRPVAQMKHTGADGAAARPAAQQDGWEEF